MEWFLPLLHYPYLSMIQMLFQVKYNVYFNITTAAVNNLYCVLCTAVGFCDAEITQFPLNTYFWPETEVGLTATLPCGLGPLVPNGMVRRTCNPDTAQFDPVSLDECFTSEHTLLIVRCCAIISSPL